MNKDYYESITRLLINELRGDLTQKQVSERMGYSYNRWSKWESGQKRIMWNEFVLILVNFKIDINFFLANTLNTKMKMKSSSDWIFTEILSRYGGLQDPSLHQKFNISKSTMYRYMAGLQEVPLGVILQALDLYTTHLPNFLLEIIKNPSHKKLKQLCSKSDGHYSLEGEYPWVSAIEGILETKGYRLLKVHSHSYLAKKLNISVERVKAGLKLLEEANAITYKEKKYVLINKTVHLESRIEVGAKFGKYWTQVCQNRFSTINGVPSSGTGWSTRVVPVSNEAKEKIMRTRRKFESEMLEIIHGDKDSEKEVLLMYSLHLFDDDELSKTKML